MVAAAVQVSFAGEEGVASSDGAITVSSDGVVAIRKQGSAQGTELLSRTGGAVITKSLPIRSDHEIVFHDSIGRLVGAMCLG